MHGQNVFVPTCDTSSKSCLIIPTFLGVFQIGVESKINISVDEIGQEEVSDFLKVNKMTTVK